MSFMIFLESLLMGIGAFAFYFIFCIMMKNTNEIDETLEKIKYRIKKFEEENYDENSK